MTSPLASVTVCAAMSRLVAPDPRSPRNVSQGRSGFGLGLALGLLFVPCAGPVLAAIVLAGATSSIGIPTIVLTVSFAIGTAIPLLVFALAGQRISERVGAFRRRQRQIRIAGGIVMLAFAVAIALNVPAALQRIVPDYTSSLQDRVGGSDQIAEKLDLGGLVNEQNKELSNCTNGAEQLKSCGPAPDITGITGWFNTPGNTPLDLKSLHGKVVIHVRRKGGKDRRIPVERCWSTSSSGIWTAEPSDSPPPRNGTPPPPGDWPRGRPRPPVRRGRRCADHPRQPAVPGAARLQEGWHRRRTGPRRVGGTGCGTPSRPNWPTPTSASTH